MKCGGVSEKNTQILHVFKQLLHVFVIVVDYRVQPLVMLVKKWAKKHDINDASCGTLSSYALTLMVLHYLQGEIVVKCHLKALFNPFPTPVSHILQPAAILNF